MLKKNKTFLRWKIHHIEKGSEDSIMVYFEGQDLNVKNTNALRFYSALRALRNKYFTEFVPSFDSVMVRFNPLRIDHDEAINALHVLEESQTSKDETSHHLINVIYDRNQELDLDYIASTLGLSIDDVVRLHCNVKYRVYAIGFSPGFGYLGELHSELYLPRRDEPRKKVPAGSVAIADSYTAIYPSQSPGGWHLIGKYAENQIPIESLNLQVGDTVQFIEVDND